MRIVLSTVAALALTACADLATPRIAGDVHSVSDSDIRAAIAAVAQFTRITRGAAVPHDIRGVSLIEIVSRDEIRFYFGDHHGSHSPRTDQTYATAARIDGRWVATELTIPVKET